MNAFINTNGVLTAWGFMESNNDDTLVEVPDDFAMTLGAAQYVNGAWVPYGGTLAQAQTAQYAKIYAAYGAAVQQQVSFKSASGVTKSFQADEQSQTVLMQAAQGYGIAGSTPTGFYWVSADNAQVPFTLADLQGLYQAILAQGWAAFQKRQTLRSQINAATTVAAVQSVVWS